MVIEATVTRKVKLIHANNPKVGDKVWSFSNGDINREPVEHVLLEKTSEEHFKGTYFSCIHVSNIYFEI